MRKYIQNKIIKKVLQFFLGWVRIYISEWERSSVWLERMPVTHEVASSIPVGDAKNKAEKPSKIKAFRRCFIFAKKQIDNTRQIQ